MNLFDEEEITLPLKDGQFIYYPKFLNEELASELFNSIYQETNWKEDSITIFGKKILQPRLTCLFGNEGKPYSYSGITMYPNNWNKPLLFIKNEIEQICTQNFTTVLANLYRNENDSNGWHADNEKSLGHDPIIASISLGEERLFQIKHNSNKSEKINLILEHGSLLLMKEGSQIHYKHQLPKSKTSKNPRINLTFRTIF
ncbi:alpha-ketoglutarate-dependent dioxygenase AlkB family protein [Flavobacterium haoranii]|uniref:Alkylated DNA repair dioxygenase AlkB n=1 Tax=Flavobacterium haoranii TaxID=683124 RepID=A0A1M6BR33_9FLAO|nr:alpha-ketoglutarate-dependent dioxygenase AlkB [Flavobacterium haoranii]SHI51161.1 Alkylated DNA repair dioxygenase AlkB [Flavobacterium haoranii]